MGSPSKPQSPDDSIEMDRRSNPLNSDQDVPTPGQYYTTRAAADKVRRRAGGWIIVFYAAISAWITCVIVKKINRLFEVGQGLLDGTPVAALPNQLLGFVSIIVVSQTVLTLTLIIWSGRMMRAAFELLTPYRDLVNTKERSVSDGKDGDVILSSVENIVRSVERILKRKSGS